MSRRGNPGDATWEEAPLLSIDDKRNMVVVVVDSSSESHADTACTRLIHRRKK